VVLPHAGAIVNSKFLEAAHLTFHHKEKKKKDEQERKDKRDEKMYV
jgi:hypothetical protein